MLPLLLYIGGMQRKMKQTDFMYCCDYCDKVVALDDAPEQMLTCECTGVWEFMKRIPFGKESKFLSGYRESFALGCNPNEISRFKKKWPWMKFTPDGRCITENYTERKRVLKARGYADLQ